MSRPAPATLLHHTDLVDVEQLAVNKISDLISGCPRLKANIAHNDKTALTDGHIDLYARPGRQPKKDFRGRVPVQVKGRTAPLNQGDTPSFPISRTDLEGYLRDRGVLYFVVYINPDTGGREPYYVTLNPFKIDEFLREARSEAASISVRLKRLPAHPDDLEALLAFAYQSRSEDPEMRAGEALLENTKEITIYTASELDIARPITLKHSELDFSVVVTAKDGTKMPADGIFMFSPREYVGVLAKHVIRSGGFEFRDPVFRKINDETIEFELSAGLRVRLRDPDRGGDGAVSLDMQSNLSARTLDVGFFLSCMDTSGFEVDSRGVQFHTSASDGYEDLRAHYNYLMKLEELFDYLAADASLVDLQSMSERQSDQLVGLHAVLVEKKAVVQDFEGPGRVLQPIGDWSIELLCVRGERAEEWRCIDLFGTENRHQFAATVEDDSEAPKVFRITPYEIIDEDRFPYTLNLHLEGIVKTFEAVADYPDAMSRATAIVLQLITGADAVPQRRVEFINAASELNEWIISKSSAEPPYLINRWQISVRNGTMSRGHRAAIRDLKRLSSKGEVDMPTLIEASCAILLGDPEDIDYCLGKLDSTEMSWLRTWPLWTLFERGVQELSTSVGCSAENAWQAKAIARAFKISTSQDQ